MIWLAAEWHKICIAFTNVLILVVHWEDLVEKYDRFLHFVGIKKWLERRKGERRKSMSITEIVQDVELVKQILPELEAFYQAGQALFAKVEAIKAAKTQAAGAPPTGQV